MKRHLFRRGRSQQARRETSNARGAAHKREAAIKPVIEQLEDRQLLSCTIDLRVQSTGGKTASVTSVGQSVVLVVYAQISGTPASGANDGFQSVAGSFLSAATASGAVAGNLSDINSLVPAYTANGAQTGTIQDLNGDGNLDIGSNDNSEIEGFFNARAGSMQTGGFVSGNYTVFPIATVTYTVTKLNSGLATDVNFRIRDIVASAYEAVWQEGGQGLNDTTGTLLTGTPVVITDGAATPTGSISGTVTANGTGLNAVQVYIDANNSGVLTASDVVTSTTSSGAYTFSGLAAGTYIVREVPPNGYTQTSPTGGISVTLATSSTAATGENFTDSAVVTSNATVTGSVFKVVGGVTSPFSGVTLDLDNSSGTLITSTTSGSTGTYSFGGLAAGSYSVKEVVPSGYSQTTPSGAIAVTVSAGKTSGSENFTDTANTIASTAVIDGVVSKVVGGVTSALAGVTVDLENSSGTLITSTTTSSTGNYSFGSLAAGSYLVAQVVPGGYSQTSPTGAIPVTLTAGQTSAAENFTDTATSASTTVNQLTGTVFGTAGSYDNSGDTISDAVDGNLSTYFDAPTANGDVVGINFGSAQTITEIKYASRSGFAGRMNGGIFEASNSPTFATGDVVLYTIPSNANPASGSLTTQNISVSGAYQYVEYIAPAGSYGNIAEFQVFGPGTTGPAVTQYSGTVFGTSGSYNNDGDTIANAVDGNLSTYFDGPTANGNVVGLNLGKAQTITGIAYSSRSGFAGRMNGGIFEASNSPTFASGNVVLYTIPSNANPPSGSLTTQAVSVSGTYQYVEYISPAGSYGNIAEFQVFGPGTNTAKTKLAGTVFGTAGSYDNDGDTIANAVDGNTSTFFDGPTASGNIVGLALGTASTISSLSYTARSGYESRMVGGYFQASNSPTFASGNVTLYTITAAPASGSTVTVGTGVTGTFLYVRYVSPANSYGNIAEMSFFA